MLRSELYRTDVGGLNAAIGDEEEKLGVDPMCPADFTHGHAAESESDAEAIQHRDEENVLLHKVTKDIGGLNLHDYEWSLRGKDGGEYPVGGTHSIRNLVLGVLSTLGLVGIASFAVDGYDDGELFDVKLADGFGA